MPTPAPLSMKANAAVGSRHIYTNQVPIYTYRPKVERASIRLSEHPSIWFPTGNGSTIESHAYNHEGQYGNSMHKRFNEECNTFYGDSSPYRKYLTVPDVATFFPNQSCPSGSFINNFSDHEDQYWYQDVPEGPDSSIGVIQQSSKLANFALFGFLQSQANRNNGNTVASSGNGDLQVYQNGGSPSSLTNSAKQPNTPRSIHFSTFIDPLFRERPPVTDLGYAPMCYYTNESPLSPREPAISQTSRPSSTHGIRGRHINVEEIDINLLQSVFTTTSSTYNPHLRAILDYVLNSPFYHRHEPEPLLGSVEGGPIRTLLPSSSSPPKASYKKSIFIVFIDVKTKTCLFCGRTKGDLTRALGCVRSHLGHRPFVCGGVATGCTICTPEEPPSRFFTAALLDDHNKSRRIKYLCGHPGCGAKLRRGGMKKHWRSKHPNSAFPEDSASQSSFITLETSP